MRAPKEIELKLNLSRDDLARLEAGPLRETLQRPGKSSDLRSVYFDTKERVLQKHGVSLRIRKLGDRHVQTIKDGGGTSLISRHEWEHEIAGDKPDLDRAGETEIEPLQCKKLRKDLKPVFKTEVHRTVYRVENGTSDIELTLDTGTIDAGRRSVPLTEVELELKSGDPAELFRMARSLADNVPMTLAVKSKAERGYELAAGAAPAATKAAPVRLEPGQTAGSAFQTIARACLRQTLVNQPIAMTGDADGIHQMRVSLRRLRAAISLFSDMLDDAETEKLKRELKWLANELGPARELHVLMKRVEAQAEEHDGGAGSVAELSSDLRQRRDQAIERARASIESARFRALMLDTAAWIETGGWTRRTKDDASALRERPIEETAAEELERRRKKVKGKGKQLDALDPDSRHRLRINGKKLRYAAEFFGGAFPGKASAKRHATFVKRLEDLQDCLGELNDIAANGTLTARVAEEPLPATQREKSLKPAFAAGRFLGREEARIKSVLKRAARTHAAFRDAKPFWR